MELTAKQNEIVNEYYKDNAWKLRMIIDRILRRFGGIYNKDKDDFYSLGNDVFVDVISRYKEGKVSFAAYLTSCLNFAIMEEITSRNTIKRGSAEVVSGCVYEMEFQSTISDTPVEDEVVYRKLIESLPSDERIIVNMRLAGIRDFEIRKITGWSQGKFYRRLNSLHERFGYAV